jgi:hypothetical protein
MERKVVIVALAALILVCATGCMAHTHTVGAGSKGMGAPRTARQWYILWGIVPINQMDSKYLAGDATDYTVHTWVSPLDFIINLFTGYVSIYTRSVEVWK